MQRAALEGMQDQEVERALEKVRSSHEGLGKRIGRRERRVKGWPKLPRPVTFGFPGRAYCILDIQRRHTLPMRVTFNKSLLLLPAALVFSSFAWAQTTAIEGDVKGEDGKPLAGAQIKIVRTDVKGNYKVKTDKKGHYYYGGLAMGTYTVTLEVEGKDVDSMSGIKTSLGDPKEVPFDVKAALARNAAAAPAPGGAACRRAATGQRPRARHDC